MGWCASEAFRSGAPPHPRRHIFQGIEARREQAAFYVRAQFLEIYNEVRWC